MNEHQMVRILFKIEGFRSWRPGRAGKPSGSGRGMESVDRIAIVGGERVAGVDESFSRTLCRVNDIDVRYFPESRQRTPGLLREGCPGSSAAE